MDIFFQDIRYAARKLMRTPGFTTIAVATLALAIGATTAVFSIVNGVLLKPLPFPSPDQLAAVSSVGTNGEPTSMSGPDFMDYRDQSRSFAGLAAISYGNANLTAAGTTPVRLEVAGVGAPFFDLLGVKMQLGRGFTPGEDRKGAAGVAVLSDRFWRTHFNGDARVIGQPISIDNKTVTVVGIAPPSMTYPRARDVWTPFVFEDWMLDPENRGAHFLSAIGRVKPEIAIESARREIASIGERLRKEYPRTNTNYGATAIALRERLVGNVRTTLVTMLGAVGFVLLIACANVANLLLVRASGRETEIAVRTALGAGRWRIVRQLITESILLSFLGALIGGALASWAVDAVVAYGPRGLPRLDSIAIDTRVLLFGAGISLLTGLLFGLVPAIHAARTEIGQMLKESVRGSSGRRASQRTRGALVVSEMALAVVLLVGAGLLIRSFTKLIAVDPGFRVDHVLTFSVSVPEAKYPFDRNKNQFTDDVLDGLRRLPGSRAVAAGLSRPMQDEGMRVGFDIDGRPPAAPGARMVAEIRPITPGYFSALGISLERGRLFTAAEGRWGPPPVVVVSQEFVRRYFANENPIGKHIAIGISHDTAASGKTSVKSGGEIIGIVADVKQRGLKEDPSAAVYIAQAMFPQNDMAFVVRSDADMGTLSAAVRRAVAEVDPDMPIFDVETMEQAVAGSVAQPRFYMALLAAFAGLALLLAGLGIYGVISYTVSQRTRELGIRIALGATHDRVVRLVLGQGMLLTLGGVALGLLGAYGLTHVIRNMLYGVTAADPITFVGVSAVLLGVAGLASYLPARRAARVDPVIAMRAD
ncbi:MAG TPA: ABC transporter permease [Gemmatimonadaceae bacterium]|nr:ABC transporter permease [Gemmatimonadaceae bacterium]